MPTATPHSGDPTRRDGSRANDARKRQLSRQIATRVLSISPQRFQELPGRRQVAYLRSLDPAALPVVLVKQLERWLEIFLHGKVEELRDGGTVVVETQSEPKGRR